MTDWITNVEFNYVLGIYCSFASMLAGDTININIAIGIELLIVVL